MNATVVSIKSTRVAGWAAVASGIIGIIGVAYLIAFLSGHLKAISDDDFFLVRIHDGCVILQFLLMIGVVLGLRDIIRLQTPAVDIKKFSIGVGSLIATVVFLLLNFPKVWADVLYMFPQGIFGVSLVAICSHRVSVISRGLRWFGIVVGTGLAIVGLYPLGYALFVDTIILQIPAPSNETLANVPMTTTNGVLHIMLMLGSLLGVFPLPIWTLLIGRRLLGHAVSSELWVAGQIETYTDAQPTREF